MFSVASVACMCICDRDGTCSVSSVVNNYRFSTGYHIYVYTEYNEVFIICFEERGYLHCCSATGWHVYIDLYRESKVFVARWNTAS